MNLFMSIYIYIVCSVVGMRQYYISVTDEPEHLIPFQESPQGSPPLDFQPLKCEGEFKLEYIALRDETARVGQRTSIIRIWIQYNYLLLTHFPAWRRRKLSWIGYHLGSQFCNELWWLRPRAKQSTTMHGCGASSRAMEWHKAERETSIHRVLFSFDPRKSKTIQHWKKGVFQSFRMEKETGTN